MKKKRVLANRVDSHEGRLAMALPQDEIRLQHGVVCTGLVHMGQAQLMYADESGHHRPYLHLSGEVVSMQGDFGLDVGEVYFSGDNRPSVDFWYNFSNEELSDMCLKGLFDEGFKCPDIMVDSEYDMPLSCDVVAVPVDGVPLVFVAVNQSHDIETDLGHCGYRLGDYFEAPEPGDRLLDGSYVDELARFHNAYDDMEQHDGADDKEQQGEVRSLTEDDVRLRRTLRNIEQHVTETSAERHKTLAEKTVPVISEPDRFIERMQAATSRGSVAAAMEQVTDALYDGREPEDVHIRQDGAAVYGGNEAFVDDLPEAGDDQSGVVVGDSWDDSWEFEDDMAPGGDGEEEPYYGDGEAPVGFDQDEDEDKDEGVLAASSADEDLAFVEPAPVTPAEPVRREIRLPSGVTDGDDDDFSFGG